MARAAGRTGDPDARAAVGDQADQPPRPFGRPRRSRQAQLVSAVLEDVATFLSAQDIYTRLRSADQPVGLSTVYRCLHDLLDVGAADIVLSESGEALYRHRRESEHHHFLVCRSCGYAVEIGSPTIEQWLTAVGDDNNFDRLEHRVEVFGRCRECRVNGDALIEYKNRSR